MGLSIAQMALLGGADDGFNNDGRECGICGTDKMQATEIELQDTIVRAGFTQEEEFVISTRYTVQR